MIDSFNQMVVTEINDIITFSSPRGRFKEIKGREHYGLSFCAEGQITYTHCGKQYVSDKNHAIILPKNQNYTLFGDKNGIFPVINFECMDFLCDQIFLFPIENLDTYLKDYEQMKVLSLFKNNRTKVISIFYSIIHRLTSSLTHTSNILQPAVKYIENNFQNNRLTNLMLSRQCNISEVYFRKLFTEQYKKTPKQYIIDIRIDKAKQLLTDGILKINFIAEKCGFSNPYHFSRTFKEKTGLTPTEYMKQNVILKI